jgi:hypothetical protein
LCEQHFIFLVLSLYTLCFLPLQELVHWQSTFKEFYSKHYSSYRQLAWQHSMSTAMLRASFPKGAKELSVSLLQALVLLLFNDADELSYEAIKDELGVKDDKELQRTLLSLSAGKVRWLWQLCYALIGDICVLCWCNRQPLQHNLQFGCMLPCPCCLYCPENFVLLLCRHCACGSHCCKQLCVLPHVAMSP